MPQLHPANGLEAGQVFSSWTVLSFAERRKGRDYYNCRCACSKVKEVSRRALVGGNSSSCGKYCARKGLRMKAHPLYSCWAGMRSRCYNPAVDGYENYGGRGITICKEWRDDLYQFAADMGPRPAKNSIDRRDNDGDYCPENCRWATAVTQSNNRRSNRYFTIDGESKTLADWARVSGVKIATVNGRVNKQKWTIEKALSEPVRANRPKT